MRKGRKPSKHKLCILAAGLLLNSPGVFAYLDPSTGSMVISAIVGIVASIALALKTYWYRIKAFFKGSQKEGDPEQESELHSTVKQDSGEQDSRAPGSSDQ